MLSAVILTKNAADTIKACLQSVSFADEIIVIDDLSTDETKKIVRSFSHNNLKLIEKDLEEDFSAQRNFALTKAEGEWVLFIDSDETVSDLLAREIQEKLKMSVHVVGYYIQRKDELWGSVLRYGETGEIWLLRLARKDAGEWSGMVHEEWRIQSSNKGKMKYPLIHHPHKNIASFLDKINWYTSLRAKELYKKKVTVDFWSILFYPQAKFFQNYVFKKGY